jgi:hypothetical protein
MKTTSTLTLFALLVVAGFAAKPGATPSRSGISGDYLEVRTCDIYTGPCFANAEMGLTGKEGILVWSVRQGAWNGVALDGLKLVAVVRADDTLGDQRYHPRAGRAVLIVDNAATRAQHAALVDFARRQAGTLLRDVAEVRSASIEANFATCARAGCSRVKAGDLVEISTRCLGGQDHLCGNEELYYPPLTQVQGAYPAVTEVASYKGGALNLTWEAVGQRSAYLAAFAQ